MNDGKTWSFYFSYSNGIHTMLPFFYIKYDMNPKKKPDASQSQGNKKEHRGSLSLSPFVCV